MQNSFQGSDTCCFNIEYQVLPQECGLISLKMITDYYGMCLSLDSIRSRCIQTDEGVSLYNLNKCSQDLGFLTMMTKCSINELISIIPLPTITYLKHKHYVVIYYIDDEHIWVADPLSGYKQYTFDEFSRIWYLDGEGKGVLLVLELR